MLIALTMGQTCQTLTFLDISEQHVQRNEECFYFALTEHLKQDRQNFWQCRPLQVSSKGIVCLWNIRLLPKGH